MTALLLIAAATQVPSCPPDSVTPSVKIVRTRSIDNGVRIWVDVHNYRVDANGATNPQTQYNVGKKRDGVGHFHVYVSRYGRAWNKTVSFSGATNSRVVDVQLPSAGVYKIIAVLEHDDHAQRVKASPRDFPPVDFGFFWSWGNRRNR